MSNGTRIQRALIVAILCSLGSILTIVVGRLLVWLIDDPRLWIGILLLSVGAGVAQLVSDRLPPE